MATQPGTHERTVAEVEAQRAAEQDALRNVRKLTESLESEQLEQRRLRRRALKAAGLVALILVLAFLYTRYYVVSPTAVPKQQPITVPEKVELPRK
jgi:hypothetical protein